MPVNIVSGDRACRANLGMDNMVPGAGIEPARR